MNTKQRIKKIELLKPIEISDGIRTTGIQAPNNFKLMDKINEIIDSLDSGECKECKEMQFGKCNGYTCRKDLRFHTPPKGGADVPFKINVQVGTDTQDSGWAIDKTKK